MLRDNGVNEWIGNPGRVVTVRCALVATTTLAIRVKVDPVAISPLALFAVSIVPGMFLDEVSTDWHKEKYPKNPKHHAPAGGTGISATSTGLTLAPIMLTQ
jgi:steroid 5-alpha reductase family enzyme